MKLFSNLKKLKIKNGAGRLGFHVCRHLPPLVSLCSRSPLSLSGSLSLSQSLSSPNSLDLTFPPLAVARLTVAGIRLSPEFTCHRHWNSHLLFLTVARIRICCLVEIRLSHPILCPAK
uniref:Uncharacterized protein n=1 Tax=Opuntia streptacantha TaxID=393608 RepID=A0A7C8ZI12_OPUST